MTDGARRHVWTAANAVMLLALAFSVVVQFNDADPWLWVAVYGAAGLVCALELRRRTRPAFAAIVAIVALGWAATIAPRVIGTVPFTEMFAEFEMQNIGVEESREIYVLLIVGAWMAPVTVAAWRRRVAGHVSAQRAQAPEHELA